MQETIESIERLKEIIADIENEGASSGQISEMRKIVGDMQCNHTPFKGFYKSSPYEKEIEHCIIDRNFAKIRSIVGTMQSRIMYWLTNYTHLEYKIDKDKFHKFVNKYSDKHKKLLDKIWTIAWIMDSEKHLPELACSIVGLYGRYENGTDKFTDEEVGLLEDFDISNNVIDGFCMQEQIDEVVERGKDG